MDKINELLEILNKKVPASMAKRLDGLNKLNDKAGVAKKEYDDNPSDDLKEQYDEILSFIDDTEKEIVEDLQVLVEKAKQHAEKQAEIEKKQKEDEKDAQDKIDAENARLEQEKIDAENAKTNPAPPAPPVIEQPQKTQEEKTEEERIAKEKKAKKDSSFGLGAMIIGGILLVASAGAINYFRKK